MGKIIERIVDAQRMEDIISVFGSFDENIKRIEDEFHVSIVNRGTELKVSGDEEAADQAVRTLEGLLTLSSKGEQIDEQRVRYLMNLVREGNDAQVAKMAKGVICITAKGKPVKAKTVGQQAYVEAIDAKVAAGERLPGNETLTNSTLEASYLIIERLNKLLTDVQRQKAQCIKQLAELRNMSGGGKSELVDDWVAAIQAAEGMDDDTP